METGLLVVIGVNAVGLVVHYVALSSRISKLEVKVCHLWKQHEGKEAA